MVNNGLLVIFFTNNNLYFINKVEKVVDDVNEKVESLRGLFQIVDFTTDKLVTMTDKIVEGVSMVAQKLFFHKKNKKIEEDK